jgi:hypothetical protein
MGRILMTILLIASLAVAGTAACQYGGGGGGGGSPAPSVRY